MATVDTVTSVDTVMQEMRVEMGKQKLDLYAMLELISMVSLLFHQQFATDQRQYYIQLLEQYQNQVNVVVAGHTSMGRTVAYIGIGLVSIGCGVGGGYGAYAGKAILKETCERLAPLSQGLNSWVQISTDWKQATQERNQADLKLIEQKRDYVKQDISESDRKVQAGFDTASRIREQALQAFSELARPA